MPPENEQNQTEEQTTEQQTTSEETSNLQPDENEIAFIEPDFSELTDFVDVSAEGEAPVVETVAEETETPAEETPPEETPETVEAQAESEEVEETEEAPEKVAAETEEETPPEKEAVEEVEQPPEVQVPTKEELEGMYKEHRENTLPTLEQLFVLDEETANALDEQPSKVIPKLAGRMMYDTMLSTYNAVMTAAPAIVNRLIEANNSARKAESAFYERWPDLNEDGARAVVNAAVKAYRSTNPRAKLDEVIKQAGVMAMINLGKDPTAVKTVKTETTTKAKPKAPAKPAAPRGTTQTAPPPKKDSSEDNMFAELTEVYIRDNG